LGRAGRLLALLALGWVILWLVPGLVLGRPTLLLTADAPEGLRLAYVAGLYVWILLATRLSWRSLGPRGAPGLALRPGWGGGLATGLAVGITAVLVHRLVLALAGAWLFAPAPLEVWLVTLGAAPALALAEEYLFRGFLFGGLRQGLGRPGAYLLSNGFFALVHLFRPGGLDYKLGLALGLFLAGSVLCRLVEETGSLWPAVGLHTVWIYAGVVDPRVRPGWFSGLDGDPVAGAAGWLLLGLLWLWLPRVARPGPAAGG
ncbi:MAG TPA: type II CAAX endopeptidase family protein, partial [Candidatus Nitrosotenuis sp.]|nr:type II CAAX endopeptidase family protein [Candidatus Nitrosotenuis sp.]